MYVHNVSAASSSASVGSGFLAGFVHKGAVGFYTNCIGQVSQTGFVIPSTGPQGTPLGNTLIGVRADLNKGGGFIIAGTGTKLIGNYALRNSQETDNTYDGFTITGGSNMMMGNQCDSVNSDAKQQRDCMVDNNSTANGANTYTGDQKRTIRGNLYTVSGSVSPGIAGLDGVAWRVRRGGLLTDPTNTPATCTAGLNGVLYFDTSLNELCFCNATNWCKVSAPATCTSSTSCG